MNPDFVWLADALRRSSSVPDDRLQSWSKHVADFVRLPSSAAAREWSPTLDLKGSSEDDAAAALVAMNGIAQLAVAKDRPAFVQAVAEVEVELNVDDDLKSTFRRLAAHVEPIWPNIQAAWGERNAAQGVLPAYESVVATYELRAVCIPNEGSKLPKIVGLTSVASIRLDLDTGDDIAFQCSKEELTRLRNDLSDIIEMLEQLNRKANYEDR